MKKTSIKPYLLITLLLLSACDSGTDLELTKTAVLNIPSNKVTNTPDLTAMVFIESEQHLFIADKANNRIHVYRSSNDSYFDDIFINGAPVDLIASADDSVLFVRLEAKNEIHTIRIGDQSYAPGSILLGAPATSMAIDANDRLYVGDGSNIKVFDVSDLENVTELAPLSDKHGFIAGINNNRTILVTSEFDVNHPMVSAWNLAGDSATTLDSAALFGSTDDLTLPGSVVFQPSDERFFVLTQGTESFNAELPVYKLINGVFEQDTDPEQDFYVDYTPTSVAFNRSGDRVVIAHSEELKNGISRPQGRHPKVINDVHVFDTNSGEELSTVSGLPSKIFNQGIVVTLSNKVYVLLGSPATNFMALDL